MRYKILKQTFLVAILFCSCNETKTEIIKLRYFDLKTYFEIQINHLATEKYKLKKTVIKDQAFAEKYFETLDWKTELAPFSECDINKAIWHNSYVIDTSGTASMYCIKYTAKDSSLKIKSINFCLENDSITFIKIEKRTDNVYYNNITTLNYFPMKAYSIRNSQKISFTKGSDIEVKAIFIK